MDKLANAINGGTVTMTDEELLQAINDDEPLFRSVAEIDAWCTTFGLQYTYDEDTNTYTIKPL